MVETAKSEILLVTEAKWVWSIEWIENYSQYISVLEKDMPINKARTTVTESISFYKDDFLKGLDIIENITHSNNAMKDALENATTVSKTDELLKLDIPNISFMTISIWENNEPICDITNIPNFKETELFIEWFIQYCNKYNMKEKIIYDIINKLFFTRLSTKAINNLLTYTKKDYQNTARNMLDSRFIRWLRNDGQKLPEWTEYNKIFKHYEDKYTIENSSDSVRILNSIFVELYQI